MGSVERSPGDALLPATLGEREFEDLAGPHVVVLTAIAARLVGGDYAHDVVQEALLRAWLRWSTFDPARGTLRAWLAAIVVDKARRHRVRGLHAAAVAGAVDRAAPECDSAQRLAVEAAVRSLPRRQREVVVLFYLADLSVEDTARALGLRPGSVKAHLAAARGRLKTQMEDV